MYDSNSKGISYTAGFFILIAFAVVGLFIGTIASIPVWTSMTGKGILAMKDELGNPAYSNAFKMVQAISTLFGFFVPAIATAFLLNRKPYKLLGFTKKFTWQQGAIVILIMFLALFISGTFTWLNQHTPIPAGWKTTFKRMEDDYNSQVQAIMQLKNFSDYILALLVMAFLPALCEETLFRAGLQNFLTRSSVRPWLSILIVSCLFSAVHLSFYGFLPRMFLGVMLGLVFHYTGSIWLCILGHFFNNALAVTEYYASHGKPIKEMALEQPTTFMIIFGICLVPVVILLFRLLKKVSPQTLTENLTLEDIRDKAPWEINE